MQKPDTRRHADVFKALADETRLTIMLLLNTRPRSVTEIVEFFSLSQPTISRHLMALRQARLVDSKRKGQQIIYSVNEAGLREGLNDFVAAFECLSELGRSRRR
jgi:DNA-binding transcriptional ArsR family regulator